MITKIIIVSILMFCTGLKAQEEVIISSAVHSVISGYTMYYQTMDRNAFKNNDPMERSYSRTWHTLQTFELVSAIGIGITIALDSEMDWKTILTDLAIAGGVRWIVRDGTYQLLQGNSFWNLSKNTTAQFEMIGLPVIKILFLSTALFVRYILCEN